MASGRGLDPDIPDPPGGIQGGEEALVEEAPPHMRMGVDDEDKSGDEEQTPKGD